LLKNEAFLKKKKGILEKKVKFFRGFCEEERF
jgi:hypothetical protein